MTTVNDILQAINTIAPFSSAIEGDNVGLLAGRGTAQVTKVLIALDATTDVIEQAKAWGAELIVAHHPVTRGTKHVSDSDYNGERLVKLLESGIACIGAHTNLDAAVDGVNDLLADACGLRDITVLDEATGLGRIGYVDGNYSVAEYAAKINKALNCASLRYCGNAKVHKVAVGSGGMADYYENAVKAGCDTFITGDVRYHLWSEARDEGMNLIDAGHFETEIIVCAPLRNKLADMFGDVEFRVAQEAAPFMVVCV